MDHSTIMQRKPLEKDGQDALNGKISSIVPACFLVTRIDVSSSIADEHADELLLPVAHWPRPDHEPFRPLFASSARKWGDRPAGQSTS